MSVLRLKSMFGYLFSGPPLLEFFTVAVAREVEQQWAWSVTFHLILTFLVFPSFFLPQCIVAHIHIGTGNSFLFHCYASAAFDERDVQQFRKQKILEIVKITVRECGLSYIVLLLQILLKAILPSGVQKSIPMHFFSIKLLFILLQLRRYNFLEK